MPVVHAMRAGHNRDGSNEILRNADYNGRTSPLGPVRSCVQAPIPPQKAVPNRPGSVRHCASARRRAGQRRVRVPGGAERRLEAGDIGRSRGGICGSAMPSRSGVLGWSGRVELAWPAPSGLRSVEPPLRQRGRLGTKPSLSDRGERELRPGRPTNLRCSCPTPQRAALHPADVSVQLELAGGLRGRASNCERSLRT